MEPTNRLKITAHRLSLLIEINIKLIFIFCLFTVKLSSQTPEFKNFTVKDGLITDEVYNLHRDKQGYIWVFSKYGTLKYNGTEFIPVLKNLPFRESFIYSIYENKAGKKWVANSNAKIYEIKNDSAFMIEGIEEASKYLKNSVSEIGQLYVDDSLNIIAITKGHTYKFIKRNNLYYPVDLSKTVHPDSSRIRVMEVGNEVIRIMDHFKDDEFMFSHIKHDLSIQAASGKIYKFQHPPFKINPGKFKKFGPNIYFIFGVYLGKITDLKTALYINAGFVILCCTEDKNKHTWVGCLNGGLLELNEEGKIINRYLDNTTINDVLIDHQSGIWVSTPGSGLFRCGNFENKYFKKQESLGTSISFIKKIENKLFIAANNGDIFMSDKKGLIRIRKADKEVPLDMVKINNAYLVVFKLHTEKVDFSGNRPVKVISEGAVFNKVLLKNNDTLIYIWRRGISFSVKGILKKQVDFGQKILSSMLDGNTLWLGTETGVYQYTPNFTKESKIKNGHLMPDSGVLIQPHYLYPTKEYPVIKIVKDPFNKIWFCTEGAGLFELSGRELINYGNEEALRTNIITNISFDENGSVLLSTNKGLFISALSKSGRLLYNRRKNIYTGTIRDALQFENKLYASSEKGLVIIDPKKIDADKDILFFNLAYIKIDAKEVDIEKFKGIQSFVNSIELKFDAITFEDVKPAIKFVLHGPLSDSGFVNDGRVKLERLAPGDYTLSAMPYTKTGKALKIQVPFYVIPAFWQTAVFRILSLIGFIVIIVVIVLLITGYNRKKEKAKAKNEQLITEYKLIALKAQINPHFMSNCLSAIQYLIKDNQTDKATSYIAKFGLMVRQILDFSSQPLIGIGEELELLRIYMELEQLRFENKFIFHIKIEDDISLKETFLPPLLLNPIVENAIWHGLLPVQNQRQGVLQITIKRNNETLIIFIEDNGIGRQPEKDRISNGKIKSYGIQVTEQRLANINYLYKTHDARITFTDLADAGNDPVGTLVTIFLPLHLKLLYYEQD